MTPKHHGRTAPSSSCLSPAISPMACLSIISCVTTRPIPAPVKVSTTRLVVERVCGCSLFPQQVTNSWKEQQMFELVVPRRTGVNMMLDTTIQKEGIGVSVLCEDQVGGLSVIKLLRVDRTGTRCKLGRGGGRRWQLQLGGSWFWAGIYISCIELNPQNINKFSFLKSPHFYVSSSQTFLSISLSRTPCTNQCCIS